MKFHQTGTMVTEAIAHQGRSMLFRELAAAFQKVKDMSPKEIRKSTLTDVGIDKIIQKHTGLLCPITVDMKADYPNAWVEPPMLDVNHALFDDLRRDYFGQETSWIDGEISKVFGTSDSLMGTVDREKSRVTGAFTKVVAPMTITRGLLTHPKITAEGCAFITLHETGHVFTYFEFFGRTATFNGALQASAEAFMNAHTREDRLKIIKSASHVFQTEIEDVEALASVKSREVYTTTFARSYLLDRKSALGSSTYDITLWESLADQFAMRHGAGKDGVDAMSVIYAEFGGPSTQSRLTHVILTLLKVLLWFLALYTGIGAVAAILMLFIDPSKKIYDDPRARLNRMRNDMVSGLKSPFLSNEEKQQINTDLKAVDELAKKFNDKRGLIEFFYTSILPAGRRQTSQRLFQLELEKMAANDLLIAAVSIDSLKK